MRLLVSPEGLSRVPSVHAGRPLLAKVGTAAGSVGQTLHPLVCTRLSSEAGRGGGRGVQFGRAPHPVPFVGIKQDWGHIPVHPPGTEATTIALPRIGDGWGPRAEGKVAVTFG